MIPEEKQAIQTILNTFPGAQVLSPQAIADEVATWGQAKREAYEERAGIVQEGEKCSRAAAENLAYAMGNRGSIAPPVAGPDVAGNNKRRAINSTPQNKTEGKKSMAIINEALACAKIYAQAGWAVHPLTPGGKRPMLNAWQQAATTDLARIDEWWRRWPAANVGIVCGRARGLVVVDIDFRVDENGEVVSDGMATWNERWRGMAAGSLKVQTPGGGWHMYFKAPPNSMIRNGNGALGHGIDVKAENGQVVAPGSVADGKPYLWHGHKSAMHGAAWAVEQPIAPLPMEILTHLLEHQGGDRKQATSPEEWAARASGQHKHGGRNDALTMWAGKLMTILPPAAVLELLKPYNQLKCEPPLGERELETIVRSIAQKEARK
jgi:hypothetical protein